MSQDRVEALIAQGEEKGCINLSAFSQFVQDAELSEDEVDALHSELDERGIELTDDCGQANVPDSTYVNGDLVHATTDALQLFLNEMGRYPLLTA